MPAPYSQDLRQRVIGFMALGEKKNKREKKDTTRGRAEPAPAQAGDRPDVAEARRVFIRRQPALDPNRLVFIDETPAFAGAGFGPPRT